MAEPATFESFIEKERDRLNKQRDSALAERQTIDDKLAAIDKELQAISAYEQVKMGRATVTTPQRQRRAGGGRRGEKREAVLTAIRNNPEGITRAELIEQLGEKGNKSSEQSISNALTALKKTGHIRTTGRGMYVTA